MILYLDTSNELSIGLFTGQFDTIAFERYETKKTSLILQDYIFRLLTKHNLKISQIQKVVFCAGPGSYTGMRVGQGFVDIIKWKVELCFSFYQFQIPQLVGVENGTFVGEAFKQEFFIYNWIGNQSSVKLVRKKDLAEEIKGINSLYSFKNEINGHEVMSTLDLFEKNSKEVIRKVVEKKQSEELYYYRPLETEFKVPNG